MTIFVHSVSAQVSVWDIPKTEILINQNVMEHGKQDTLRNNQLQMTGTQVLAKQQADNFKQQIAAIHKRFQSVMGLLSDAVLLTNVVIVTENLYNDENTLVSLATNYPLYAPIVLNEQLVLVGKATSLVELVGAFVYIGTDLTQMEASDRHTIVEYTLGKFQDIQKILDGTITAINQCINQTLSNPLNVWKGYVNKDKQQFGNILLRPDILQRHGQKLFARVTVTLNGGAIHGQKAQVLLIVNPHGLGILLE